MSTTIPAPDGLAAKGQSMWLGFTAKYDFRLDELEVLERACRLSDRIASMETELGDTVVSTGSMGQVVVHPLIAEIRAHTATVAQLLHRLALPDDATGAGESTRSTQARSAAKSRWTVAHGAGA